MKRWMILLLLLVTTACQRIDIFPQATGVEPTATLPLPSLTPEPTHTLTPLPSPTHTPEPTATPTVTPTPEPVFLSGAGDIGDCGQDYDEQTAAILEGIPGTIFAAGDTVYESGAAYEYEACFEPNWGRLKERIRPAVGNHEYNTPGASGYYEYFGEAAGPPGQGYYSYELGEWHVVVLNSICGEVGCGADSEQALWLEADLQAHPNRCTLAYWHHPRWSSGLAGNIPWVTLFWNLLYRYGAEIVISGHDHDYERFAPQDEEGNLDPQQGIRQFVVGTGGTYQRPFGNIQTNSEVHATGVWGVLKLTLFSDRYDWEFVPVPGSTFTDSGSTECHE